MTTSDLAPKDAELIAAFIDRRLPKEERQAFLERLDSEEALYEVFVETVRYHDQTSAKRANVLDHPAWRKKWTLPAAIAALLALAVATPVLIRSLSKKSYAQSLVADGRLDPYLGEGWYEQPWSVTRGVRPDNNKADIAFRLGVRVVDLEIALRTGRIEDAEFLTHRIETLLQGLELSEPMQVLYSRLLDDIERGVDTAQILTLAASREKLLRDYLPDLEASYELGRWAEAGKLAARSRNRALLTSPVFLRELAQIRGSDWADAVVARLLTIEELLNTPGDEDDLVRLRGAFLAIIEES